MDIPVGVGSGGGGGGGGGSGDNDNDNDDDDDNEIMMMELLYIWAPLYNYLFTVYTFSLLPKVFTNLHLVFSGWYTLQWVF